MRKESFIRQKALKILEKEKWVYWYPSRARFRQNDIFGVFDLVCCKKKTGKIKFIQLTTLSNLSTRRKKINSFLKKNKLAVFSANIEIWAWNKQSKKFKIEEI